MQREATNLSIVIPALKEESRIGQTLTELAAYLNKHDGDFGTVEVIVVCAHHWTNSATATIAWNHGHLFRDFRLLRPHGIVGKGRDVAYGMIEATGRFRIFMDADLATPLRHLAQAKEFMQQGGSVGVGVRNVGHYHKSFSRNLLSRASSIVGQVFIAPGIPDTQCGFKIFEANIADKLFKHLWVMKWNFDMEILAMARAFNYPISTFFIPDWSDPKSTEEGLTGDSRLKAIARGVIEPAKVRLRIWRKRHERYGPLYFLGANHHVQA